MHFALSHGAFDWLRPPELGTDRREQEGTLRVCARPNGTHATSAIGLVIRSPRRSTVRWPRARDAEASPAIDFSC